MNYYISDYHLGFERAHIIDKAPYKEQEERFCDLVNNWNSCVKQEDTVYILGDLIWKSEYEDIAVSFLSQTNGKKYLVTGNHDQIEKCDRLKKELIGFSNIAEVADGEYCLILCHYPMPFYPHQSKNAIMLYGHIHNSKYNNMLLRWQAELAENEMNCKMINVGCMMPYMNFTPKTLQQLLEST